MSLVNVVFIGALLLFGCSSTTAASSCQSKLPSDVDPSICVEIQSVVYTMRYSLRKIDVKVKETVVVALKEARKILDSTSDRTITDIKNILSSRRTKRSSGENLPSELQTLAQNVVAKISKAVGIAKKKIRNSIALAVTNINSKNDKIKNEATLLLQKILSKRSISAESPIARRDLQSDIQKALAVAAVEVKAAMNEAVTTSVQEYKILMDYFAPSLKALFKKANLDGNVDQAEQDIEQLAIKSSVKFIEFYDSFSKVAVGKAIKSIEGLLSKVYRIGTANPNALFVLKRLLLESSSAISEVVVETTAEPDAEIRAAIFDDVEKMRKDYKSIEAMINA